MTILKLKTLFTVRDRIVAMQMRVMLRNVKDQKPYMELEGIERLQKIQRPIVQLHPLSITQGNTVDAAYTSPCTSPYSDTQPLVHHRPGNLEQRAFSMSDKSALIGAYSPS